MAGKRDMHNMKSNKIRYLFCAMLILGFAFGIIAQCLDVAAPDNVSVFSDSDANPEIKAPFAQINRDKDNDPSSRAVTSGTSSDADAVLTGSQTKKTVSDSSSELIRLCPGGMPFGVKLSTKGVLVVGICDVESGAGKLSPAKDAGVRQGDVITAVNKKELKNGDEFAEIVASSGGDALTLSVERDEKKQEYKVTPVLSSDNSYKLGLLIKDRAAGIGTVTFYDPENKTFGGLGHGICDAATGMLLPMSDGGVFAVRIDGVNRGESGAPGELKGYFASGKLGSLYANTDNGVFGALSEAPNGVGQALPIGIKSELKEGKATIRCTVGEKGIDEYDIKISKIDINSDSNKNFVIEVTDRGLLDITGGIVQGMSGSPIIQDGKLVGAVTHVLINDPTKGYGIFIENMLEAAG